VTDEGVEPLVPAGTVDPVVLDAVDDVPVPPAEAWLPVSPPAAGCEGAETIAAPLLPVDDAVAGLVGVVAVPAGRDVLPPEVEPAAASCGTVAGGTMRAGSVGVTFAEAGVVFAGAADVGPEGASAGADDDCAGAVFGAVAAGPVIPGVVAGAVGGGDVVVPDGVEVVGVVGGVAGGVVVAGGVTVTIVVMDVAAAPPPPDPSPA
jgi:hypothetical protein